MGSPEFFAALYEFFRGASGFALIVGGLSLLLAPGRERAPKRLGLLFAAVGFLFCLSALDPLLRIPEGPSDLLVLAAILALSQSLFEIALYLFCDERRRDGARKVLIAGIAWSCLVWAIPFLDYAFGWGSVGRSVEDSASMGPLHAAASVAIYAWPIAISAIAAKMGHISLRDLPAGAPGTKVLVRGMILLILILCLLLASALISSVALYRAGHTALELLMLAWLLFASARPHLFSLARKEIHEEHEKNLLLGEAEATGIGAKIDGAIADEELLCRPELDLRSLAAAIRVPPYRLSVYFNTRLHTSFPAWLNALRIDLVRRRIVEQPGRSILEIATDAGFGSKSTFNGHFSRIVGMSPSEYRRSARIR
jgi:AraC-like DNA-binding protein